jgi:hypothetical protein
MIQFLCQLFKTLQGTTVLIVACCWYRHHSGTIWGSDMRKSIFILTYLCHQTVFHAGFIITKSNEQLYRTYMGRYKRLQLDLQRIFIKRHCKLLSAQCLSMSILPAKTHKMLYRNMYGGTTLPSSIKEVNPC